MYFIKNKLLNYIGLFEGIILFYYVINYANNHDNNTLYILLVIPAYILFVNFKGYYKIIKSNIIVKNMILNKRTIKTSGMQGGGKTSILCHMARLSGRPIYSLTPLKINGKFVNILTKDHLTLKKKIEENAICIVDEFTLMFSNIDNNPLKVNPDLRATEITIQLIRHLFNGSFWIASVDTDRAVKLLREKIVYSNQMLGQLAVKNSWFIGPFLNIFTRWKWYGYFRSWKMQTYEKIEEDGYIFDLSTDDANTKDNKFSNLLEIYAFNNTAFEYNDRSLRPLYDALNIDYDKRQFTSLEFDLELFKSQYYDIYKFLVVHNNLGIKKGGSKK